MRGPQCDAPKLSDTVGQQSSDRFDSLSRQVPGVPNTQAIRDFLRRGSKKKLQRKLCGELVRLVLTSFLHDTSPASNPLQLYFWCQLAGDQTQDQINGKIRELRQPNWQQEEE